MKLRGTDWLYSTPAVLDAYDAYASARLECEGTWSDLERRVVGVTNTAADFGLPVLGLLGLAAMQDGQLESGLAYLAGAAATRAVPLAYTWLARKNVERYSLPTREPIVSSPDQ